MPARKPPEPIHNLDAEERAVLLAALAGYECARVYAAELETGRTAEGKARRAELFKQARIAGRLAERLLL